MPSSVQVRAEGNVLKELLTFVLTNIFRKPVTVLRRKRREVSMDITQSDQFVGHGPHYSGTVGIY